MTRFQRSTRIVHGSHAMAELSLQASRVGNHGLQVMTFERAACLLAAGFIRPIDRESLNEAIRKVLPDTPMGELESIKYLPGMVKAATNSLYKVWRSGLDINEYAENNAGNPAVNRRLEAISSLERAVLEVLPKGMLRPVGIVEHARRNISHAGKILGSLEISGLTELSPCWRPLLIELAGHIPVRWDAGPRETPSWLEDAKIEIKRSDPENPEIEVVSTATPYHEAVEAMRWARSLIASGKAKPSEIAIASTSTSNFNDHFLALCSDANFKMHFVHGVSALTTRDGQATAALANILARGISRDRLVRFHSICKYFKIFKDFPDGWLELMPKKAPMADEKSWNRLFDELQANDWSDYSDREFWKLTEGGFQAFKESFLPKLQEIVGLLMKGTESAEEVGQELLEGRALKFWELARLAGPDEAIDSNVSEVTMKDDIEPSTNAVWMPASELAVTPRRFVRLIGLNSSYWPRNQSEDRLIPDHVIPIDDLDPIPMNLADRRDFNTILSTTSDRVSMSFARRRQDRRQLGQSPLLFDRNELSYLRRAAIPSNAFSESDRLMARPDEFRELPQSESASECWMNWGKSEITKHDGLVRENHPLMLEILKRGQSASSLVMLLRNPIGYLWRYGFRWQEPDSGSEPLKLDALSFGTLVHEVLDLALLEIENKNSLASAGLSEIRKAVDLKLNEVANEWESSVAIPPKLIWERKLEDVRDMAVAALNFKQDQIPDASCHGEVPFGRLFEDNPTDRNLPWDPETEVSIPGTDILISGKLDRLDLSKDRTVALVRDYKTGKAPRKELELKGGSELQRCLYSYAVKSLLGEDVKVTASLFYPVDGLELEMKNPDEVLTRLTNYIVNAKSSLAAGNALPGIGAGDGYFEFRFALPAGAEYSYLERKEENTDAKLSSFAEVWEEE